MHVLCADGSSIVLTSPQDPAVATYTVPNFGTESWLICCYSMSSAGTAEASPWIACMCMIASFQIHKLNSTNNALAIFSV